MRVTGVNHSLIILIMEHYQIILLKGGRYNNTSHHISTRLRPYIGVPLTKKFCYDASLEKKPIKYFMKCIMECVVVIKAALRCTIASGWQDISGQGSWWIVSKLQGLVIIAKFMVISSICH